jgi:peroxiredoxin Q/BCP
MVHPHKLKDGEAAPDFTATDMAGKKITLSKLKNRYVLLVFLRYAGCPWCNLAIHRLALEYPFFEENDCRVIAFIQSEKSAINENIYERHSVKPAFSIVADHAREFYELYGVGTSITRTVRSITKIPAWVHSVKHHGFKQTKIDGNLFIVPAAFIIDVRSQKIIKTGYGKDFYDEETFVDLYQSIMFNEL